ncbi:hypothetical protein BX616_007154 [Lobosporangium transversale]|uniref:Uncharacterized protein n=1 Tax=Lobosporangium transversale TaxID=64571 RepID=A0A1Y2GEL8_9FUNG|nr:hypothetical protein BCR41DRAFT_373930 [Lobosporangium transversale]KAF9896593.1 hypothetical protein BX616_007154 [Lobosporangium transversale]ORZ06821.1 hypothetical protein BCR41DRAFT_373930 [Lobosporangium transversale]|eukprot:XP_021877742.1 hypothetical protein BCR41DRAFT_373930 [Lobosporangium transversale]
MGYKTIITIQIIMIILTALAVALDCYFIKQYNDNNRLVFAWRFYVQFGLNALICLYFISSLIALHAMRRKLRYQVASGRRTGSVIAAIIRVIFVLSVSAGLLYTTLQALINQRRSNMILPFPREAPGFKDLNNDYSEFDARNLFSCPSKDITETTLLCNFDQSTMLIGALAGVFAIIETALVLTYQFKSREPAYLSKQEVADGTVHY